MGVPPDRAVPYEDGSKLTLYQFKKLPESERRTMPLGGARNVRRQSALGGGR